MPGIDTLLIHAGQPRPRIGGAAVTPVFQSAVFEFDGRSDVHDLRYPRLNNLPNHRTLHARLAALEGAQDALVTASGMAAITTTLLTVAGGGGRVLVQDCLYGGTHDFLVRDARGLGITFAEFHPDAPATGARAVYVEALSNPLLQVIDHRAVVAYARAHGLVSIVDATFATPVNFRPIELGYDLVIHSATKYLNGHSDLVAGVVAGDAELVGRIKRRLDHLGGSLDPHACFLLERGLKTLALRVRRQNDSALRIARFLESRPEVSRVHYPGLESHPHHARAREYFSGCGGVLSFELAGGTAAADTLIGRLELPVHGPSLGGVETLITRPATTSHAGMTAEERRRAGIPEGLVRLSVGIEDPDDLIADLAAGLDSLAED